MMKNKRSKYFKICIGLLFILIIFQSVLNIHLFKTRNTIDFNTSLKFDKYKEANRQLLKDSSRVDVVFVGNSITELWAADDYNFFSSNNYISRGIGGQSSSHLLLRFQTDVIMLKPKIVVINAGINDIAEGLGEYNPEIVKNNIKSMVQLAKFNNIEVVTTSLTPSGNFSWNPLVCNVSKKIDSLNSWIRIYAKDNNIVYVDYNTSLRNHDGSFNEDYTFDGVHPNKRGFDVMKNIIKPVLDDLLNK